MKVIFKNYRMNVKAILFLLASWIQCILCDVSSCEPAEKNSEHVITFRVSSDYNGTIQLRSNQEILGQCKPFKICNTYYQSRYNISQTYQNQYSIIKLTIFNVSDEKILTNESIWYSIQNLGSFIKELCKIPLYVKLQNVTCEHDLLNEGIYLKCSAQAFDQEHQCRFLLNDKSIHQMGNITYINTRHEGNMGTSESSCTLFVQSCNLKPGIYNVNVTMFPIVTGTYRDIQLGSIMTSTLSLESPRVSIAHCLQVVHENAHVSCSCLEENSHPANVSINWYDMNDQMQNRNPSHIITFEVDRKQPDYYCQATNAWLWRSEKMFYNLSVLYPGSVKTFTVNGESRTPFVINQSSSLSLHCETEGNPRLSVKLLNGNSLLIQNVTKVELIYIMSCNSSNVFQCIAEQENGQCIKNISIYKKCPIQLKDTPTSTTLKMDAMLNQNVFIILDVYGYPKPTRYSLIQNNRSIINFDNVSSGNAMGLGYVISYQDTVSPFGRVNLSFNIIDHNILADYSFILDNGIIPKLNYSFSIQRDFPIKNHYEKIVFINVIVMTCLLFIRLFKFCLMKAADRENREVEIVNDLYELNWDNIQELRNTQNGSTAIDENDPIYQNY